MNRRLWCILLLCTLHLHHLAIITTTHRHLRHLVTIMLRLHRIMVHMAVLIITAVRD